MTQQQTNTATYGAAVLLIRPQGKTTRANRETAVLKLTLKCDRLVKTDGRNQQRMQPVRAAFPEPDRAQG